MKSSGSLLTPILRSDTQGRLLAELVLHPDRELTLTDLAKRVGVAAPTIMRDVDRLVAGGTLKDRRQGRSRLISANDQHPMYRPLREIVLYGYGPAAVLPELLRTIPGIAQAYLYGSWAERYTGTPGADPADIDVLVIGTPDRSEIYDAARRATEIVGREVNINVVSPPRWAGSEDGFIDTVKERALVPIEIGADR
ncbi:MAG: MarR family transcriptional regulator [Burkholderiaceae bacterium]|nr:MarR family transcriptional regulator [Microbacteriaceae bacterium]